MNTFPLLLAALALGVFSLAPRSAIAATDAKPRLIVLSDMGHDPDDEQEFVHLLACSNEVDIEGLITVTGRFFRRNPPAKVKDLRPHLFLERIDAYEKVYPNLGHHADSWPRPDYLRSIVARGQEGNGMADVGEGKSSAGSRLIVAAVLRADPRPLHVVVNSGANTLAQALFDLRAAHAPAALEPLLAKLRVFDNSGQDESGAWICHTYPSLHYIRAIHQNRSYGGPANDNLGPHTWKPHAYTPAGQDAWAEEHVRSGHGALGATYPPRFTGAAIHFIEGGGTTPWMRLVCPGLTDPSEPSWGGWSGRYTAEKKPNVLSAFPIVQADEKPFLPFACYTDSEGVSDRWTDPADGTVYDNVYAGVWRWRAAMWNDFQARMDWCVKPFAEANHHPRAALNGDLTPAILRLKAKPGEALRFDARASTDPDGDALVFSWWIYAEAGTYAGRVTVDGADTVACKLTVPADAAGKQLHLILEVRDRSPIVALYAYRRVVIEVAE